MGEPAPPRRIIRFGVFEVDLRAGELRKQGLRVRLQEKPFQVLTLLLERSGEVVTREELQQRLWPDTFVDFEHSLSTAIKKLRDALGDSADNPRFIETRLGRGYRFIGPMEEIGVSVVDQSRPASAEGAAVESASEQLPLPTTRIQEATTAGVSVIRVVGTLTAGEEVRVFEELSNRMLEAGRRLLVLNLSRVSFIDTDGLEAVLRTWDRVHVQVGKIALVTTEKLRDSLVVIRPPIAREIYPSVEPAVANLIGVPCEQVPTVDYKQVYVGKAKTPSKGVSAIGSPFSRTARDSQIIGAVQLLYALPFAINAVIAPGIPESILSLGLLAVCVGAAWIAARGDVRAVRTFDRFFPVYIVLDFLGAAGLVAVAIRLEVLVAGLVLLPALAYLPFYQRRIARDTLRALSALIIREGVR